VTPYHPSAPPLGWLVAGIVLGTCVALVLLPVALLERAWREARR
jgi:hypothetical protein